MSYRELRNFTEMLRALGYPRQISIENFRTPNFKLVAEIIVWLLKRYDPDYDLPLEIDTEQERVIFIKQATLFLIQKARIKVNPKKLYEADGYAVQEMLKIATVLYNAIQQNESNSDDIDDNITLSAVTRNINSKLNELRLSRQLASEITERGASLYDLLAKEIDLRGHRSTALARNLELNDVEKSLRGSITAVEQEIKETLNKLNNIASDEANLDVKIEKRKADLERQQKRLAQLQAVRPAYMDEYDRLEQELQQLYTEYVHKFRNLTYLDQAQRESEKFEQERTAEAEMSLRKMVERMREEEKARLQLSTAAEMENAAATLAEQLETQKPATRPGAAKVFGSMTGAGMSDDENEDESPLSDDDDREMDSENEGATGHSRGKTPARRQRRESAGMVSDMSEDGGEHEMGDKNRLDRRHSQNGPPRQDALDINDDSDGDF